MQITDLPTMPSDILSRLASIPGATPLEIAEAAWERGVNDGIAYKTLRAQESARKKDIALAWDTTATAMAGAAKVRSDLELRWYRAMCNAWGTVEYEPETFWVTLDSKHRKYTPDWRVTAPDGRVVYLETKPMPWINPSRSNPHRHTYGKQAKTMQAVIQRHKITLYVLSGEPTRYDVFQPLGLDYKQPFSMQTLARLGRAGMIPKEVQWPIPNKPNAE